MDVPTRPGDVLAQPTRARLFGLLSELRRPAGTEELAKRLGLHPNGVRLHLERMRKAGLVVRERERIQRGRPRDMWSVAPDARPAGHAPTAYDDLALWLARVVSKGGRGARGVEKAGRQIGHELITADGAVRSPERRLHSTLAAMGFQPQRIVEGDRLTYRLCNCPYRDVARRDRPVVCGLHRGITQGLIDAVSPGTKLVNFVANDPDAAGCLVELRGPLAAEAAAAGAAAPAAATP